MIEYATGEDCPAINIGVLHKKLANFLNGKKFLIVLDDVWTESCDDWDRLRSPLRVGAKGSKIIVTTRSEKVCKMMSLLVPIHLSFLPNHYCWALFKEKAFGESSSANVAPNLEAMGMKIVEKCKGLPLAVKVIGGALRCTRDEERWMDIFESEIWNLPEGLFLAWRLSYQHLPSHLKRCFEYCSLFPADYKFERNMLVRLWMAEGLLPTQGKRQPEDIGNECFDELLWRSFFQIYEKFLGYYTMHGLLHSLGSSVGGKFYFRTASATQPSIATEATRHSYMTETLTLLTEAKHLRTLIRVKSLRVLEFIDRVMEFKCLHVLDLGNCSLTEIPESMGDLKHLQYLNLVKNLIKYLPHSICNLYNMQTLHLMYCANLVSLPKCIGNLINLRYLSIEGCKNLKSLPQGIRKLTCHTKLDVYLVGKESREEGIRALKDMNKLRGHLDISNLENIGNVEEAIADLKSKQYLTKMVLEWRNNDGADRAIDADVLEALRPHTNLREIIIQGYGGTILPTWMGDSSFSNLTRVKLYCCKNAKSLSPLGQLPALQSLVVNRMDKVKHMGSEFFYGSVDARSQSFQSLEELYIGCMVNREEWCGVEVKWQLKHFSRLRKFIIFDCPQLQKFSFDATNISRM